MEFTKYQHVEKLGNAETNGILDGICHIFYKIDGTNASVWLNEDEIRTGSRNRELSIESDNAGFCKFVYDNISVFDDYFMKYPDDILYGEWLVPHSLRTYRDDSWRDFYVFDVLRDGDYVPYEAYKEELDNFGINYIPPLATIKNPMPDQLNRFLDKTGEFLVKDGEGKGEGIVIKNYNYRNKFGRQTWGKIVTNEFKERHHKEMGAPKVNNTISIEEKIVDKFLTEAYISKEYQKISLENEGWHNKFLPRLFGVVTHEFIRDEIHSILKELKNPTINFKWLNQLIVRKCKDFVDP